ncbi:hypothetical protein [Desulfolucanica intricata]|uniref:hypothetical protein n=1 Tax=Desulfolucanica intricata TaxID=1285191 RepID=UPI00082F7C8B|nr:hypothetical protein [Desulfolucanica intricata]
MIKDKKFKYLIIILVPIISLMLYYNDFRGTKVKTNLINPVQVNSFQSVVYFLDKDISNNSIDSIKKYENGNIYDVSYWVSKDFLKTNRIIGLDLMDSNKFIILTEKKPLRIIREPKDVPLQNNYAVYLLDDNKKQMQKLFSKTVNSNNGFIQNMFGQVFINTDKDGNVYLPFSKEVVRISAKGKQNVILSLGNLPNEIKENAIGFYQIAATSDRLFILLKIRIPGEQFLSNNIMIETDKNGKFIKTHQLFTKSEIRLIKSFDNSIFIVNREQLYQYNPKTKSIKKLFDEPLDDIHKWIVFDISQISNGYILLVTDSDTGNLTRIWKLTGEELQKDFLITNSTRD